jgi:Na+-transporting NADH:ubiquinone oxidoreductase subunit A
MEKTIKIKHGLDIPLTGKAKEIAKEKVTSSCYTVFPGDYTGLIPKTVVKSGDKVLAGSPLMFDKNHPGIKIVSPVSGEVIAVNRGEKRKLESIVILSDDKMSYADFAKPDLQQLAPDAVKTLLADAGIAALIRQRPYDVTANPDDTPRDIFVPGFYSAPLSPDIEYVLQKDKADFRTGLNVLAKLTPGSVYVGIRRESEDFFAFDGAENIRLVAFEGPHPAGNAGVQINHIRPVNKGETVWTVNPQDVVVIGRFFNKGIVDFTRLVALTGSEVDEFARAFYPMLLGASIENLVKRRVTEGAALRYISGNVLTGTQIAPDGSLHAFDNQITVIPEGNGVCEFVGWMMPGFDKFSVSRSYPAFLLKILGKKTYRIDARIRGGRRAMIMSNEWDRVFPMDILPEFLVRAMLSQDIDQMESLGAYEVAPEDFALCEFVDTSKMELQRIVREGLDMLYKEMS